MLEIGLIAIVGESNNQIKGAHGLLFGCLISGLIKCLSFGSFLPVSGQKVAKNTAGPICMGISVVHNQAAILGE